MNCNFHNIARACIPPCVFGLMLVLAGGCTNTQQLKAYPCDVAWDKMVEEAGVWTQVSVIWRNNALLDSETNRRQRMVSDADERAKSVKPMEAFDVLVSNVAKDLPKKLVMAREIAAAQHKQVLLIGTVDRAPDVQSVELDFALRSLAAKLQADPEFNRNFVILSMSDKQAQEALRAAGANQYWKFEDPSDPTKRTGPVSYNPHTIYQLSGTFYRAADFKANRPRMYYNMMLSVEKVSERRQLLANPFVAEYRYHPAQGDWITRQQDETLWSEYKKSKGAA